ncbi:MAG: peptidoglycan DD-metalloendopeptidase family protein [Bifidobacteriaceae bacterium]|jgi:murein DD-endopeptidase MepM/ murein hydrolase activator NlpD|nr:peptidoglycan DD-metalloendopeptidase family protein [Bifidobacteriaceae bacterium]
MIPLSRQAVLTLTAVLCAAGLAGGTTPPATHPVTLDRPEAPAALGSAAKTASEPGPASTSSRTGTSTQASSSPPTSLTAGGISPPTGGLELAGAAAVTPRFRWPLADPVAIVRPFDLPEQPWLAGHRGVDLTSQASDTVYAPGAGTVSFNGWIVDRHVLVVRHGELASTLEPVLSDLPVGDAVQAGQALGAISNGEASHCPGCLHWGVRRGDQYLDPTLLIAPRPRAVLKH